MKIKLLIGSLIAFTAAVAVAATDPVVMTINGKDVKLSEFEYLYKKNSAQQVEPETLDQYVDRFVTYKLKVADAEAAGIDTLPELRREIDGYRADIIAPYLNDTTVREQLAHEAYDRMLRNVDISHFMLPRGRDEADEAAQLAKMDSLRNLIVAGKLDFNAAADEYSIDRSVKMNHGNYGLIDAGMFPYAFDKVAFSTPVGEISKPFKTDFGIHLIRVNDNRPAAGTVVCEHILLLFPRKADDVEAAKAAVKVRIDSIYTALKGGADFEETARQFSQDPGSAKQGGKLPEFGHGRMVKPFEKVAFELPVGEISQPFETAYGYHIIKKLAQNPVPSYEQARQGIINAMAMDERANAGRKAMVERLRKDYKVEANKKLRPELLKLINKSGSYSPEFVKDVLSQSKITAYTYTRNNKKVNVPISTIVPLVNGKAKFNNESAAGYIESRVNDLIASDLLAVYSEDIINNNEDYSNLLHEYRDGSLLYEISKRRVYDAPKTDYEGLNRYFLANKAKYDPLWDTPHFKGVVLYAANDSAANAAKSIQASMIGEPIDSIATRIHQELGPKVVMERKVVDMREDKNVDYLVFNGTNPNSKYDKYPIFFILEGKVLNAPEEASDVRGYVSSDYQTYLEQLWLEELHKKYPVVIHRDVLKKVKPNVGSETK